LSKFSLLTIPFLFLLFSNIYAKNIETNEISQILKEKKLYPKGKKIYEKACTKDINLSKYKNINELKEDITKKNLCKKLDEKNLEALSFYLWDIKRVENQASNSLIEIFIEEKERCPVCAMFVSKYPRWVAQIVYKEHKYSFDGVKDLMKFYFEPNKWGDYNVSIKDIDSILVTDYYSQTTINGEKAFYVIGSNVYGPMGNELIPFESLEDAKTFKSDHQGKKIIKFEDINVKDVYKLDEL